MPRVEGLETGDWVLIDGGDIIVHVFRPEIREFYNIEKMWAAPGHGKTALCTEPLSTFSGCLSASDTFRSCMASRSRWLIAAIRRLSFATSAPLGRKRMCLLAVCAQTPWLVS